MSQPLLFVSPDDSQVHKVTASEVVSLEEIDAQIAHHQGRIDELNVEKSKFLDLTGQASTPAASTETPAAPADASSTAQAPAAPSEPAAPAAPVDVTSAPAAPAAPADATTGDQTVATPPISA